MDAWTPIWTSLRIGVAATLVAFPLGLSAALLAVWGAPRLRRWMEALILLPLLLAGPVIGWIMLLLLFPTHAFSFLVGEARIPPELFSEGVATLAAIIHATPFIALLALWSLRELPKQSVHLGRVLGLSNSALLWRVVLPSARKPLAVIALLGFARSLGEFGLLGLFGPMVAGRVMPLTWAVAYNLRPSEHVTPFFWVGASTALTLLLMAAAFWMRRGSRIL